MFIGIGNEENCSLSHWTHEELLAAAIPHHVELGYIAVQSPRLLPKSCGRQDGQGDLLPTSLLHVALDQVNALVYRSLGHGHYLVGAIAARFNEAKFCQQLECLYEFNDYFFRNTMEVFYLLAARQLLRLLDHRIFGCDQGWTENSGCLIHVLYLSDIVLLLLFH